MKHCMQYIRPGTVAFPVGLRRSHLRRFTYDALPYDVLAYDILTNEIFVCKHPGLLIFRDVQTLLGQHSTFLLV